VSDAARHRDKAPHPAPDADPQHRGAFASYLRLALPSGLLFAAVYFATNWFTAQRAHHYRLYFDWELSIPFVPAMIYAYASILVLFLLPPLLMKPRQFPALARALLVVLVAAAAVYLLLPAEPGFQRPGRVPGYDALFQALYALDQRYNLLPSLHIACAVLCIAALLHARPSVPVRLGLALWAGLLSVSVLLVHQHHLLDVLGGWLLGVLVYRLYYLRRVA
jgi:membrane-associated phospholipid phosphatase